MLSDDTNPGYRVNLYEGTHIRGADPEALSGPVDLVVADLSFISLRTVAAALPAHAIRAVDDDRVTHEMASADEFRAELQRFASDGQDARDQLTLAALT